MVFPVVGGTQDTSYEISNSLRFNDDDDAVLDRGSISGTLSKAHTFSLWVKRSTLDDARHVLAGMGDGSGNISWIEFNANSIRYFGDGAGNYAPQTTAKYRDVSAWYHIVVKVDTTQSSASDRLKIYVNGTEQAYSGTPPPQNHQADMDECTVGFNPGDEFDGYMAEFHFLDGVAYDPTYFGETNDNGVWIPKKYTGGNYGTFGFYLQFKETGTSANSSGMGADTSGNDNHFSATNLAATDVTTDTPTNNFCTLNPLVPHHSIFDAETQGNTGLSSSGVQLRGGYMGSTIMPTSGKWYFEVNILSISNSSDRTGIAIPRFDSVTGDDHIEGGDYAGLTLSTGSVGRVFVTEGSSTTETDNSEYVFNGASVAIFAVDMDASTPRVYVGKNGTWFTTSAGSGGNPATNTGYFEANLSTGGSGFSVGARHSAGSSASQSMLYNFGQPAYTISSGNSDANGYGNFEYAVPSGYYAICTKNLAEYG
jgi:hypothetical protein